MATTDDIEELINILEDGTPAKQKKALATLKESTLAQPGAPVSSLPAICPFATAEDPDVRHDVALILSNAASDKPSDVIPHADTVRTLLTDDDPFVLSSATAAAMFIARESPAVLSDAVDRLLELLIYENAGAAGPAGDTRGRAVTTLGHLGEADRVVATQVDEPFADRLTDSDPDVRAATVLALTQLGLTHPEAVSTALARLPTRLDDDHAGVRRNAIRAYTLFQRNQPTAIVRPDAVATSFREAAERTDIEDSAANTVSETCQYIEEMASDYD